MVLELDHCTSVEYRNWFNNSVYRVLYGINSKKELSYRDRLWLLLQEFLLPVAFIATYPLAAIAVVYLAARDRVHVASGIVQGVLRECSLLRFDGHIIIAVVILWNILIQLYLPGLRYEGPPCGNGYRPLYLRNGFVFFILSTFATLAFLISSHDSGWFIIHSLPALSSSLVVLCLTSAIAMYIKARVVPSKQSECAPFRNLVYDFYNGIELYPRSHCLDLKLLLIRSGNILNLVVLLSCVKAQIEMYGANYTMLTLGAVQYARLARRYWNEEAYAHSFEVTSYNVGLREFLRHLVLKPLILNLGNITMVFDPVHCPPILICILGVLAFSSVVLTYLVDRQKFLVKHKKGKCHTWGKMALILSTFYMDNHGLRRASQILYSGYWGQARHLNYTGEAATFVLVSLPGLLAFNWYCLIPPLVLICVLLYRINEDYRKCRRKYGPYWQAYCEKVPFVLIPGLY